MYALTQQGQLLAKGGFLHCWNCLIITCRIHHQKPTCAELVEAGVRIAASANLANE
jgi:hypothetical protein